MTLHMMTLPFIWYQNQEYKNISDKLQKLRQLLFLIILSKLQGIYYMIIIMLFHCTNEQRKLRMQFYRNQCKGLHH